MVTLEEIHAKIGDLPAAVLAVPQTGQTECWDAAGTPVDCAGTGQDGEHRKGTSVDPRFTDSGDGTATDNLTGLIWLKRADCFPLGGWNDALSQANGLASGTCGLTDGSVAGDWRLPNVRELMSLIEYGRPFPALPTGHPFTGVQNDYYWASTTSVADQERHAWGVHASGEVWYATKSGVRLVWPVRGGQ
jgi:hypothetical protein